MVPGESLLVKFYCFAKLNKLLARGRAHNPRDFSRFQSNLRPIISYQLKPSLRYFQQFTYHYREAEDKRFIAFIKLANIKEGNEHSTPG